MENLTQYLLEFEFLANELEATNIPEADAAAACIRAAAQCLMRTQDATSGSSESSESPLNNMN